MFKRTILPILCRSVARRTAPVAGRISALNRNIRPATVSVPLTRGALQSYAVALFSSQATVDFQKAEVPKGSEKTPVHIHGEKKQPAVIVIQEWWGVDDQIKVHAAKIASKGYRVLIPDLYRGKLGLDAEEASHLMDNLDFKGAVEDVRAAAKFLKADGAPKVGVIGFCMGGALTVASNTLVDEIDAGVCFYGTPPEELAEASKMTSPIQCHFGNKDTMKGFSDPEAANQLEEKLKKAGVPYELYRYENVAHAFMNEEQKAVELRKSMGIKEEDKEAVESAWQRTFQFFDKYLKN